MIIQQQEPIIANYTTQYGCDSNYTLNLTVNPVYAISENQSICEGQNFHWQGNDYSTPGTYYANYSTQYGCDSNYTLNLIVNPVYTINENHSICEGQSFHWQGNDYSAAGTYYANYTTRYGCDSIYTLNLVVNPVYAISENHSICEGQNFHWQGNDYSTAGTYYANYSTQYGCDSNYTLNLQIKPVYTINKNQSICEGQAFHWQGNDYSTPGTYYANYSTQYGCDSNYTLNLQIKPVYTINENQSICEGQSFHWQGNDYSTSGTYYAYYNTINGCDSNFILNLFVNPVYTFIENQSIFEGQSYYWQGNDYLISGTYLANYYTSHGCDSNYTLHLVVLHNFRTLHIKVFLEGLYLGNDLMKQAQDLYGPHFGVDIADQISIELHNITPPYDIIYEENNVALFTNGILTISNLPNNIYGLYYLVIKHRNSIETWSYEPLNFDNSASIHYDFSIAASQAYGYNLKPIGEIYAIWAGDATEDGIVDGADMAAIDNASIPPALQGYYPEDVNGDGVVDGSDMAIIDNNSALVVHVIKP